jgi:hypothetical protein
VISRELRLYLVVAKSPLHSLSLPGEGCECNCLWVLKKSRRLAG